ncbi:IS110 family transposase [Pseudomonas fluorescens]|uniref:IS110 family transposase n=1 Tax=Pseudomonas fluorescens TaxID=294 RepID=UPI000CA3C0ED|nr:IS110 family transposase [Pseudomonas fluorescens]AUM68464.1 IS110 family transposase [Pseudomonas fluorescens]AUM69608.1 IS110 family transposase [Pseudomonas fluorescens]AUM70161.1 IS110 family transposase [Pseudomonas fluorescens]AUM71859.1 IS110 family transposase [Pseudomonas fluorescens]AUM72368.1 IS110 family transposase [Pseudomonas fluorescens]
MTILNSPTVIGIDVAKAEIVVYREDLKITQAIANNREALGRWLKTLPAQSSIALEATSFYHLDTAELAHGMGFHVYVVDPYRVAHYRESIGLRAKTDPCDARLLARYLTNEQARLRIWSPPPEAYKVLKSLLRKRAALIKARVSIVLSFSNEPCLKDILARQLEVFKESDQAIQKLMREASQAAGITENINRCKAIEGIGELTAIGLATAFMRGHFVSGDAFIAFLGMDLRPKDSGKKHSPRHLSKKGDGELRRLAHNAAMAACRSPAWKPYYEAFLARGLARTQALVILARKLCRVAFALMKNQSEYQPNSRLQGSPAT